MSSIKNFITISVATLFALSSCEQVKEENKIFHAGPVESGFGVIYFGLYKENTYQFCNGDFMNPGCYTGTFRLSGDTITLDG